MTSYNPEVAMSRIMVGALIALAAVSLLLLPVGSAVSRELADVSLHVEAVDSR